jgi:excisionase family DNA binding protein
MITAKPLLTAEEMASILNITPRHLYDLRKEGKIPSIKLGRCIRFDVDRVLEEIVSETDKS